MHTDTHTHTHTDRNTAPILWPRPLTREVKNLSQKSLHNTSHELYVHHKLLRLDKIYNFLVKLPVYFQHLSASLQYHFCIFFGNPCLPGSFFTMPSWCETKEKYQKAIQWLMLHIIITMGHSQQKYINTNKGLISMSRDFHTLHNPYNSITSTCISIHFSQSS